MDYQNIRQRPKQFIAVTGLKVNEFEELLQVFEIEWQKYNKKYTYAKKRRQTKPHKIGKGKLPTSAHKLFFILFYYKNNPIQAVLAAIFDIDQPQANRWIKKIENILQETLAKKDLLPARTPEALYQQLLQNPVEQLLLDGVERPIPRSVDQQVQKDHYSGKKKDTW